MGADRFDLMFAAYLICLSNIGPRWALAATFIAAGCLILARLIGAA